LVEELREYAFLGVKGVRGVKGVKDICFVANRLK
jgi:hypothetical protein